MKNNKGILFTSYLGNIKNLNLMDKSIEFIIIMRKIPKEFDLKKYKEFDYNQALSPSSMLLKDYIINKDWNSFKKEFNKEMLLRNDLKKALEDIYFKLLNHNVCLICCEKDYLHCHRFLLAQYYIKKGFKHKEM